MAPGTHLYISYLLLLGSHYILQHPTTEGSYYRGLLLHPATSYYRAPACALSTYVPTRRPAYAYLHLPTPAWLPTPARSLPYLPPALCKTSLCTRANQLHFGPPVCWLFSVPRLVAPPQPGYQLAYTFPSTQLRHGVFREIHRETYWSKYSLFEEGDYKPMSSSIVWPREGALLGRHTLVISLTQRWLGSRPGSPKTPSIQHPAPWMIQQNAISSQAH